MPKFRLEQTTVARGQKNVHIIRSGEPLYGEPCAFHRIRASDRFEVLSEDGYSDGKWWVAHEDAHADENGLYFVSCSRVRLMNGNGELS